MQHELIFAFIIIFAIDSLTPRPAIALVMSRGISSGLCKTLPFIAGLVVGDLVLFLLALLGLVALVAALGPFFIFIKWLGILYLLYLAYKMWNAKPSEVVGDAIEGRGWRSFGMGVLLPLGNPKAVGFYVALLPAVLDMRALTVATGLQFSLIIVVIWSLVLVGYTSIADQGRRFLRESSSQKWLHRGAAGAMVGAAGIVALRD